MKSAGTSVWFALTLALALGGCAPSTNPPPPRANQQERSGEEKVAVAQRPVDDLLELMRQRLLVQHEVARYKWHAHLPILDAKRERQLLLRAEDQARDMGLEPGFVRAFFQAQMQAGKLMQQADFDGWRRGATMPPTTGPDLMALRHQLDGLNRKLLKALKEIGPDDLRQEGHKAVEARAEVILQGQGITAEVRRAACAPFLES